MPKISIITTTYKHQDFIAQTIESVLAQTYTDWELLIGDDSPDNATWDIIQKYVDKYPDKIKAWHHSPNKGIVDNMNFLIEEASDESDYISFLEGDDMYTPDNLEEKMKVFEEYPEVKLVYSDFMVIDDKGKKTEQYNLIQNKIDTDIDTIYHFALDPNNIFSWSNCMIEKELYFKYIARNITGGKSFSVSDWDFYARLLSENKYIMASKKLFYYRVHGNNLSFQGNSIAIDMHYLISFYFKSKLRSIGRVLYYAWSCNESIKWIRFFKVLITYIIGGKIIAYIISKKK